MSEQNINKKNQGDENIDEMEETDEMTVEEDADASENAFGGEAKNTIVKLRERLKQAESEKQEYLNGWQKTRADYVNSRKNDEEERRLFAKFAEAGLISDILPVLDSFDIAFGREVEWKNLPEEWQKGVRNIYNQLTSTLTARGLKSMHPIGEIFDPSKHEAVANVQTSKKDEDHKILDVIQKGYTLHDKLIRTARVRVGEYVSEV
ncbi:MAG: nucleotide exchange factor GrpE [Patescibacteria group bacterium]